MKARIFRNVFLVSLIVSASTQAADTLGTASTSEPQTGSSAMAHSMPAQFGPVAGDSSEELLTRNKLDVTIQLEVSPDAAQALFDMERA